MDIQWYPGHMKKAIRQMQEDLKLIDLVIEIADARIPRASRNPDIEELFKNKSRVLLLGKSDLADSKATEEWLEYYKNEGLFAIAGDARDKKIIKRIMPVVEKASKKKRERDERRGIKKRPIRSMVVGIPNGGKSTFINTYSGKASAKTGNKPGVTRGRQWIRLSNDLELLDTPGILWPKFEDPLTGFHLAVIGSIKDEILGKDQLAHRLVERLEEDYPGMVKSYYGLDESIDLSEIISEIAIIRKALASGGVPDTDRACDMILDDFRSGKFGRITLERL